MPARYLLAIDPGVEAGFAVWDLPISQKKGAWPLPLCCDQILPPGKLEWEDRVGVVLSTLRAAARMYPELRIVCEWPGFFEGSDGGMKSARSGALLKLMFVVGRIAQLADECKAEWKAVPVGRWKGQLPKMVVRARLLRRSPGLVGVSGFSGHAVDAVGIGYHELGYEI